MGRKTLGWMLGIMLLLQGTGMMEMTFAANGVKTALIVVDPGMSGYSLKVAQNIASKLQKKNIPAKTVKAKDFKAQDLSGIDLLVLGGPTYAAQPSVGLKQAMAKVNAPGLKTLLYQTGGRDCAGLAPLLQMAEGKGLTVLGSGSILFNKREASYLDKQVDQLLGNI